MATRKLLLETGDAILLEDGSGVLQREDPIFVCGAECQNVAHWSSTVDSPVSVLSPIFSGFASWRIHTASNLAQYLQYNFVDVNQKTFSATVRVRFAVMPNILTEVILGRTAASNAARVGYDPGTGNFAAWFATGTVQQGPAATAGIWYKIDIRAESLTGTSTIDWFIDDVAQTQATLGQATHAQLGGRLGMFNAATADYYGDDFAITQDWTDFPISTGSVPTNPEIWTDPIVIPYRNPMPIFIAQ